MNENRDVKQARILVVDDEPVNLTLMEEVLDEEGFNNVIYLDDPLKGLACCENEIIDLILLDWKMPVIDGFQFMQKLQNIDKSKPPILVLTASADNETHDKVISANAQGIISKPFDLEEVIATINSLIDDHWAGSIL